MRQIISQLILNYFRFFGWIQLKKNPHSTIIGITGSAGKTSLRLALYTILKTRGVVKQTSHANSQSGISLNILGLRPRSYSLLDWLRLIIMAPIKLLTNWEHYNYYIVEMGIDGPDNPKNMSYLLSIVTPHVGVVLNAGLTHSANFDYLVKDSSPTRRSEKLIALIAKEKMHLATGIPKTGVAVINLDQKEFMRSKRDIVARQITFGRSSKADLLILPKGRFKYQGTTYSLDLSDLYPESYSYTFAAAIAASAALGIPPTKSIAALTSFRSPAGRLRVFPGITDSTIIDSSYNASPLTVLESLKLLKKVSVNHKKIAVIGDMRELGLSAKLAHKDLADSLLKYSDEAILFGELTRVHTLPVLLSKKFKVHHFKQMSELTRYLKGAIKPKSYILVKGSQNEIFLERAVEAILADHSDVRNLARRGQYWDKIRAHTK